MHLSFALPLVYPWDTPGEPTGTQEEWYSLGISFSPRGREVVSFGNDFTGLREHTHRIYSNQLQTEFTFFHAILFHFDAKFRYCVATVRTFP